MMQAKPGSMTRLTTGNPDPGPMKLKRWRSDAAARKISTAEPRHRLNHPVRDAVDDRGHRLSLAPRLAQHAERDQRLLVLVGPDPLRLRHSRPPEARVRVHV